MILIPSLEICILFNGDAFSDFKLIVLKTYATRDERVVPQLLFLLLVCHLSSLNFIFIFFKVP